MDIVIKSSEQTVSDKPLPVSTGKKLLEATFWKQSLEASSVDPTQTFVQQDVYIKKSLYKEDDGSLNFAAYGIREEQIVHRFDEQKETKNLTKTDVVLRNPMLENSNVQTLKPDNFPPGISRVAFVWKYLGQTFPMYFQAGFVGIREVDGSLHSDIHWAVTYAPA